MVDPSVDAAFPTMMTVQFDAGSSTAGETEALCWRGDT
jgi:hypothetical protein